MTDQEVDVHGKLDLMQLSKLLHRKLAETRFVNKKSWLKK